MSNVKTKLSSDGVNHTNSDINKHQQYWQPTQLTSSQSHYQQQPLSPLMFISVDTAKQYCIQRAICKTIMSPLDRVKYVMQCQKELIRTKVLTHQFKTSLSCARYLARMQGIARFWRGNLIQVLSVLPILQAQLFISLPTQLWILRTSSQYTHSKNAVWNAIAGLGGVVAACMISYPLQYARFRLAVDLRSCPSKPYLFRHSLDFFAHRTFADSPHFLYTGMPIFIAGSVIYQGIYNVLLKLIFPYLPPDREDGSWTPMIVQTMSGFAVVGMATLCLHPLDLIRRRMMIAVTHGHDIRYSSARQCFRSIWRSEGLRGLYRGSVISLVRIVGTTVLLAAGLQD